jgi:hypothetical protein
MEARINNKMMAAGPTTSDSAATLNHLMRKMAGKNYEMSCRHIVPYQINRKLR